MQEHEKILTNGEFLNPPNYVPGTQPVRGFFFGPRSIDPRDFITTLKSETGDKQGCGQCFEPIERRDNLKRHIINFHSRTLWMCPCGLKHHPVPIVSESFQKMEQLFFQSFKFRFILMAR
jgi:hypothetical protein